jgi:trans-aconitate methyltransferase
LVAILKKNKIRSFIDLGCGAGVLLKILTMFIPDISVKGVDNEETLVQYCNKFMAFGTKKRNILSLKREDIESYQVIYFYEPFTSRSMAQRFVENLSKIVTEGQYIIYMPAGSIQMFLREAKNIKEVNKNTSPWLIYKVTKTL